MASRRGPGRPQAATEGKRERILAAARKVFEAEGLERASLRAIAAEAGYTPAALYFHFDSKEAIYAKLLRASLSRLQQAIEAAITTAGEPGERLHAAAMAFFAFYANNPRDLDLGFYLFRGGVGRKGLGRARDEELNAALARALAPIGMAAQALGATRQQADLLTVDAFAHATGLLLLEHTGRLRIFAAAAPTLMDRYVQNWIAQLEKR